MTINYDLIFYKKVLNNGSKGMILSKDDERIDIAKYYQLLYDNIKDKVKIESLIGGISYHE